MIRPMRFTLALYRASKMLADDDRGGCCRQGFRQRTNVTILVRAASTFSEPVRLGFSGTAPLLTSPDALSVDHWVAHWKGHRQSLVMAAAWPALPLAARLD